MRALNLTDIVQQICPQIVNTPDRDYVDHKLEKREEFETIFRKEKEDIKI